MTLENMNTRMNLNEINRNMSGYDSKPTGNVKITGAHNQKISKNLTNKLQESLNNQN